MKGLYFLGGAVIGSLATYFVLKDKYATLAENEIDEIRDYYKKKTTCVSDKEHEQHEEIECDELRNPYISDEEELDLANQIEMSDEPEIIDADLLGICDDYDQIPIYYWACKTITDDYNDLVEDVIDKLGNEAIKAFNKKKTNEVFVVNHKRKAYYIITRRLDIYNPDVKPHHL